MKLKVDAPPEFTAAVQARFHHAAAGVRGGAEAFWGALPGLREAVAALPELEGFWCAPMELRVLSLDGYRDLGIEVPRELYEALGVELFYQLA